jgi:hypothetical protein
MSHNNMSHRLCVFGPDNRLLQWNDRYVKMDGLAPDRLRVGCTPAPFIPLAEPAFISRIDDSFQAGVIIHSIPRLPGAALPIIAEERRDRGAAGHFSDRKAVRFRAV